MDARFKPQTLARLAVGLVIGCLASAVLVATRATADSSDGYGVTVMATSSAPGVVEGRSVGVTLVSEQP